LFPLSTLVFLGGLVPINERFYEHSVEEHNAHFDRHIRTLIFYQLFNPMTDQVYPAEPRYRFHYTTIAYMLSSSAARTLLTMIEKWGGIFNPPDVTLITLMDVLPDTYTAYPLIVKMPKSSEDQITSEDTDLWREPKVVTGAPAIHHPDWYWLPGMSTHRRLRQAFNNYA
jgi:hypothetical protein